MSWVEETLINTFCGARDAAALDAAQMGALSTGSTAAAAVASSTHRPFRVIRII